MSDSKSKKTTKKSKAPKNHGFNVPPKKGCTRSTLVCRYIYEIISEASPALLEREDVRDSYNHLVIYMTDMINKFYTYIPSKYNKYNPENMLNKYEKLDGFYKLIWNPPGIASINTVSFSNLIKLYTELYDLIKRDVIPFMELKWWETTKNDKLLRYNAEIERLEKVIKQSEKTIEESRAKIIDIAKTCISLQEPPTLTTFD